MLPELAAEPMEVEPPVQILDEEPALAAGSGFTVILTESEDEQPVLVFVVVTV